MKSLLITLALGLAALLAHSQAADWQSVVWREPDSREAIPRKGSNERIRGMLVKLSSD